jgi:hypothetical protein
MGFVDKLIGWAGKHPYLSAAGLLITFLGVGMALGQLYKSKDSDGTAAVSVISADFPTQTLAPTPAPTVAAANATVTPAPERYQLNYDGILIKGDKQFINDSVMTLEFGKKYSPHDYEFIKKNTREIILSKSIPSMGAGNGRTLVNKSFLQDLIGKKYIKTLVSSESHESWHNHEDLINDPKNNTEELADAQGLKAWNNLSYVNQSEIDKFLKDFEFSKYEKEIQTI